MRVRASNGGGGGGGGGVGGGGGLGMVWLRGSEASPGLSRVKALFGYVKLCLTTRC